MEKLPIAFAWIFCAGLSHLAAQEQWTWQNPRPQGYDLWAVHFVSSQVGFAAGNSGSLLKTVNGGVDWTSRPTGTFSTLYGLHFLDAHLGFAVGEAGTLLRTSDGGASWIPLNSGVTVHLFEVYFTSKSIGFVGGDGGTLLKTGDGGSTWKAATVGLGGRFRSFHFPDADTGYAVGGGLLVLKTTDGGESWVPQVPNIDWSHRSSAELRKVQFLDASRGFIFGTEAIWVGKDPLHGYYTWRDLILKTLDGGSSWSRLTLPVSTKLVGGHFADSSVGYAVGYSTTYKTQDGGAHWSESGKFMQPGAGTGGVWMNAAHFLDAGMGYAVGSRGGMQKTDDGGASWISLAKERFPLFPDPEGIDYLHSVNFPSPKTGYAAGARSENVVNRGFLVKTNNGGETWELLTHATPFPITSVHFLDDRTGFASGVRVDSGTWPENEKAFLLRTSDGGATWVDKGAGFSSGLNAIHFPTAARGYVAGNRGLVAYTRDAGETWETRILDTAYSFASLFFVDAEVGFAGGRDGNRNGILYRTADGGKTWTVKNLAASPGEVTSLYFPTRLTGYAVAGAQIFKSRDGGLTWSRVSSLPGSASTALFPSQDSGYAVGNGIFRTADGGKTWNPVLGSGGWYFTSLALADANTVFAVGSRGAIVKGSRVLSTPIRATRPAPGLLALDPQGGLRYELQRPSRVEIRIFDVRGRMMAKLFDQVQEAGCHRLALPHSAGRGRVGILEFRSGGVRRLVKLTAPRP